MADFLAIRRLHMREVAHGEMPDPGDTAPRLIQGELVMSSHTASASKRQNQPDQLATSFAANDHIQIVQSPDPAAAAASALTDPLPPSNRNAVANHTDM